MTSGLIVGTIIHKGGEMQRLYNHYTSMISITLLSAFLMGIIGCFGSINASECPYENVSLIQQCPAAIRCDGTATIMETVSNDAADPIIDVTVQITLPSCFRFVSGAPSDWAFAQYEDKLVATYTKPLLGGETSSFMFDLQAFCCPCKSKHVEIKSLICNSVSCNKQACCSICLY